MSGSEVDPRRDRAWDREISRANLLVGAWLVALAALLAFWAE